MNSLNCNKGFTLVELMVSVALLAIISVLTYAAIQSAFHTYDRLSNQGREQSRFVAALGVINEDMANLVARPVRTNENTKKNAFHVDGVEGEYLVEFTRGGLFVYQLEGEEIIAMGLASPQTGLARVAYGFRENGFYRYEWTVLDPQESTEESAHQQLLFENVADVQIIAYSQDQDGKLREEYQWPPVEGSQAALLLPVAISIRFFFQDKGEYVLFFPGVNNG